MSENFESVEEHFQQIEQQRKIAAKHILVFSDGIKQEVVHPYTLEGIKDEEDISSATRDIITGALLEFQGFLSGNLFPSTLHSSCEENIKKFDHIFDLGAPCTLGDVKKLVSFFEQSIYALYEDFSPPQIREMLLGEVDSAREKEKNETALYEALYCFQYYPEIPNILKFTGDKGRDRKIVERKEKELQARIDRDTSQRRVNYALELLHKLDTNKMRLNWFARISGSLENLIDLNAFPDKEKGQLLLEEAEELTESIKRRRRIVSEEEKKDVVEQGFSIESITSDEPTTEKDIQKGDDILRRALALLHPDCVRRDDKDGIHIDKEKLEIKLGIPSLEHLDYAQRLFSLVVVWKEYPNIRFHSKKEELELMNQAQQGRFKTFKDRLRFHQFEKNKLRIRWFTSVVGFSFLFLNETHVSDSFKEEMRGRLKKLMARLDEQRGEGYTHELVMTGENIIADILKRYFKVQELARVKEIIMPLSSSSLLFSQSPDMSVVDSIDKRKAAGKPLQG